MDISIFNDKTAKGPFKPALPPGKSLSHRALIAAFLAGGGCVLHNVADNNDVRATAEGLEGLGSLKDESGGSGDVPVICCGESGDAPVIDCGESASTLRLLLPLAVLKKGRAVFTGKSRLTERPLGAYEDIFRIRKLEDLPPGRGGIQASGTLKPGSFVIPGNVSSQIISGLLFALPLLDGDSEIVVLPPFESSAYVDLTLQMLSAAGVRAEMHKPVAKDHPVKEAAAVTTDPAPATIIKVPGGQKYKPFEYTVPADWSAAANLKTLAFLTGKDIKLNGLDPQSAHPDRAITGLLGALAEGPVNIDISGCPDLGPLLFALASQAEGTSVFTGAERLRLKESDRIKCMQEELSKLGCLMETVRTAGSGHASAPGESAGTGLVSAAGESARTGLVSAAGEVITVTGATKIRGGVRLSGHGDHRIAMALSVLACCAEEPVIIEGAECINKSWPGFFEALRACGVSCQPCG